MYIIILLLINFYQSLYNFFYKNNTVFIIKHTVNGKCMDMLLQISEESPAFTMIEMYIHL